MDFHWSGSHPSAVSTELPEGYSWRRAALTDAAAILALISEYNTAVVGYPDCTLDDVADQLVEPGFELDTDSWLVHTADGTLVGFGWAYGRGSGEHVDIEHVSTDDGVDGWLLEQLVARATEMAGDHTETNVDQGIYRSDARLRAVFEAHGFSPATTFHRMRVDHDGPREEPVAPSGVTLRPGPGDEHFRRTAHRVLVESFKDHFGWIAQPFDQWHESRERESTFDWSQLTLAALDGEPVAILLAMDRFVEDDNCGYIADLGVLAEARGRGIAKYLLRIAFGVDQRAGRAGTILHVDTNNTTPALGVYESVGMRPVMVIDVWRRTV